MSVEFVKVIVKVLQNRFLSSDEYEKYGENLVKKLQFSRANINILVHVFPDAHVDGNCHATNCKKHQWYPGEELEEYIDFSSQLADDIILTESPEKNSQITRIIKKYELPFVPFEVIFVEGCIWDWGCQPVGLGKAFSKWERVPECYRIRATCRVPIGMRFRNVHVVRNGFNGNVLMIQIVIGFFGHFY